MNTFVAFSLHITLIVLGAICLAQALAHMVNETKTKSLVTWMALGIALLFAAYQFGELFDPIRAAAATVTP